ncbi:MAG: CPBP family intramembrane metalloprotease [Planctomycetes bacterium]|nr:CPBP family intramembrane metalloprotease [Planctomycetota bacterium]
MLGICAVAITAASVAMLRAVLRRCPPSPLIAPDWSWVDALLPFGIWYFIEFALGQLLIYGVHLPVIRALDAVLPASPLSARLLAEAPAVLSEATSPITLALRGAIRFGCATFILMQAWVAGRSIDADWGLSRPNLPRGLGVGAMVFLALVPGWLVITTGWGMLLEATWRATPQAAVDQFIHFIVHREVLAPMLLAFTAIVVAPLLEELLFRGLLLRGMIGARIPAAFSVIATSALFALVHASVAASLPLFVFGCVLAVVFLRTGNLWVSIFLHAIFNASQILAMTIAAL